LGQLQMLTGQPQVGFQQQIPVAPSPMTLAPIDAASNNANQLDLTQLLFYVPLRQDTPQLPQSTAITLNNLAALGNVAHSVITSTPSSLNSSSGSSIGDRTQAGSVGGISANSSITNHRPTAAAAFHDPGAPSNSSFTIQAATMRGASAGVATSERPADEPAVSIVALMPNGNEMDLATDHRLRIALEVFERDIRLLYQQSMLQAGFSIQDCQEATQAYHNFAYHAWKRECQNLQRLLRRDGESANNNNGGGVTPSVVVSSASSVGGGNAAGSNAVYAVPPGDSSSQRLSDATNRSGV
jgi:hypothetical protein